MLPSPIRPIIDAHLDLAWNALSFDRDLTLEIGEVRAREARMADEPCRGRGTVTFPELRRAGVRVCVGTLLARAGPERRSADGYKRTDLDYTNPTHAYGIAQGQLAYYRELERQGVIRRVRSPADLNACWSGEGSPGLILSMEGADPVTSPGQLQEWWDAGLRALGLAHYGRGQYAYGTGVTGQLGAAGRELLTECERLGMIVDVTHLCDQSMAESLDCFGGTVLASHHNCRALVPGDRQLTDDQIRRLIARGAVIGTALDAWMLYPGWTRGETQPAVVGIAAVADHIDHVCQLAGNVNHVAIGSDLDGGFGTEQTPRDVNTIADLQRLAPILSARGFDEPAIDAVFHGNWLRFFRKALPPA